jgi:sulfite exporter TauE/SafE
MSLELLLASVFVVGLLGGVHCVGMCGGIAAALTFGLPAERQGRFAALLPFLLAYNAGRVASYALAGGLMGGAGTLLSRLVPVQGAQRGLLILAAAFMILMGLYLGGWWSGLARLEQAGGVLWRRIEPLGRRLLPVRSVGQALTLGLLWGWLPCGLVYSALVSAVSAGGAWQGAAVMLAFGLGTLPNLLAMGAAAGAIAGFARRAWVRRAAGASVLLFGLWTLGSALGLPLSG